MSAKKSGKKSGNATSFKPGADPRRGKGPPKGSGGAPSSEFLAMMRELASDPDVVGNLAAILKDGTHPDFLKAWEKVSDRGYGKAQQHMDVTSNGQAITPESVATMTEAQINAEIAKRMAAL
jgi:hypothetical protein